MNIFPKKSYPSSIENWEQPENTVFRQFELISSSDFDILYRLVQKHMSEDGNESITRHRLMYTLRECKHRALYLYVQQIKYPCTWKIRWKWRCLKLFLHRCFKTKYFWEQVELCHIAREIIKESENDSI